MIPGSGRSSGEGIGYPLQYSWASLVAQLVKNPPAMWETWFQSLGWEDALEEGMATHSRILAWRTPMDKSLAGYSPWNTPGQDTGLGSRSFLQRFFSTQGLKPGLPHCRQILYPLSHQGSPINYVEKRKSLTQIFKKPPEVCYGWTGSHHVSTQDSFIK